MGCTVQSWCVCWQFVCLHTLLSHPCMICVCSACHTIVQVEWVSVPLSNEQAGHSLKPHMFAWNDNQIDTHYYEQHCSHINASTHRSVFVGLSGLVCLLWAGCTRGICMCGSSAR